MFFAFQMRLLHRRAIVSWTHGDYSLENILLDKEGCHVIGILDWDRAAPNGLPRVDIVLLILSSLTQVKNRELGDIVSELLEKNTWGPDEAALMEKAEANFLTGDFELRELVLLCWLNHVDANLQKSGRYTGSRIWKAKNIAAVLHQNEETVELLLARGADPNLPLGDFTPHQRGSTTDFYLHKSWVGATPLWLAARFSTPPIVRRLLEHGADPLFVHHGVYYGGGRGGNLSPRVEEITTTLMAAVKMGTGRAWSVLEVDEAMVLETVELLVEAGVDVNAVGYVEKSRCAWSEHGT